MWRGEEVGGEDEAGKAKRARAARGKRFELGDGGRGSERGGGQGNAFSSPLFAGPADFPPLLSPKTTRGRFFRTSRGEPKPRVPESGAGLRGAQSTFPNVGAPPPRCWCGPRVVFLVRSPSCQRGLSSPVSSYPTPSRPALRQNTALRRGLARFELRRSAVLLTCGVSRCDVSSFKSPPLRSATGAAVTPLRNVLM